MPPPTVAAIAAAISRGRVLWRTRLAALALSGPSRTLSSLCGRWCPLPDSNRDAFARHFECRVSTNSTKGAVALIYVSPPN